jgi:hypothetical protein
MPSNTTTELVNTSHKKLKGHEEKYNKLLEVNYGD